MFVWVWVCFFFLFLESTKFVTAFAMAVRKVVEVIVALITQGGETHPIQHWMS